MATDKKPAKPPAVTPPVVKPAPTKPVPGGSAGATVPPSEQPDRDKGGVDIVR